MSSTEEHRAKTREKVARWRAANPERARAQTKEAVIRFTENQKIERAALKAEIKRLNKIILKLRRSVK